MDACLVGFRVTVRNVTAKISNMLKLQLLHQQHVNSKWYNFLKENSMTDKEKRELKDGVVSIFKSFNILDHTATIGGLCNDILGYIDSLQEEPVSEDLEEACEQLAEKARIHKAKTTSPFFSQTDYKQGVIDGAKWQKEKEYTCYEEAFEDDTKWKKEQMMKDAVDACVTGIRTYKEDNEVDFTVMYEKGIIPYEIEQEVKLIIIKEY